MIARGEALRTAGIRSRKTIQSPGGASESLSPLRGSDQRLIRVAFQGLRCAPPLAAIGRPSGANSSLLIH